MHGVVLYSGNKRRLEMAKQSDVQTKPSSEFYMSDRVNGEGAKKYVSIILLWNCAHLFGTIPVCLSALQFALAEYATNTFNSH